MDQQSTEHVATMGNITKFPKSTRFPSTVSEVWDREELLASLPAYGSNELRVRRVWKKGWHGIDVRRFYQGEATKKGAAFGEDEWLEICRQLPGILGFRT